MYRGRYGCRNNSLAVSLYSLSSPESSEERGNVKWWSSGFVKVKVAMRVDVQKSGISCLFTELAFDNKFVHHGGCVEQGRDGGNAFPSLLVVTIDHIRFPDAREYSRSHGRERGLRNLCS